ncbi:MAG: CPBP family intramembrane metalloprotease [Lachnospiraceae bacterium]|nr:CPBP family intramembrane metalloprotease [Lachnospiraceae bacterium]
MNTKMYRKDFSGLGFRMACSAVLIFAIQTVGQYIVAAINPDWAENMDIMLASTMVPLYVLGYPLAFLILRSKEKRTIEKHKMTLGQLILAFMMSYGLMIAGNLIGVFITLGIGILKGNAVNNPLMSVVTGGNIWISAIYIVLLAPVYEEFLFRKLICDRVAKYGQGTAVVVSGLMFGLFHGNFNQFFYAFFLGSFFAFIYLKTGQLKYTIGLHMVINFIGSVLGGLLLQNVDMQTPMGLIIFALYALCVYGIALAGGVLFLVNRPKMKLEAGEITIEKGSRFKTVIGNAGMIVYCLLFLILTLVVTLR